MLAVPAPFVRGLWVIAIGTSLIVSHVTFAAADQKAVPRPTRVVAANKVDVVITGSIGKKQLLADNCYWELVTDENSSGTTTRRQVQECD
jgi:hypothetical protein